ncbi:hypothetical protein CPB83DRAFT_863135 [Crepidotus variabilis]|uniref:Uncharacterized protein n=1 Tax=Crepidotus variabilis TaxID=179855 RepID=A0A9P6JJX6_9AGAR|nr:hypothetical protein CPB83DRAFT_863135 [Crepidotus variabilis]
MESISKLLGQDKRRVYMALNTKIVVDDELDESRFNTTILIAPKEPDRKTHSVDTLTLQLRRHMGQREGVRKWMCDIYDSPARSSALVGLLFFGKISHFVDTAKISEIVKEIPSQLDAKFEESRWYRHHWACAVIDALISNKILPELPPEVTSETAWQKACEFLEEYAKTKELGKSEDPVPTCDVYGNEIPSSFDPVTPNPYLPIANKVIYPSYPDPDEELL